MPPNLVDLPVASQESDDLAPKTSTSPPEQDPSPPELHHGLSEPAANEVILGRNHEVSAEIGQPRTAPPNRSANEYKLRTFLSSLNLLAHILIGAVTGISMIFAFRNGVPLEVTPLHIVLCVIGVSQSQHID